MMNAAQAALAEIKARGNQYCALRILEIGAPPLAADVLSSVGATPNVGCDFTVAATAFDSDIKLEVTVVKGVTSASSVVGIWIFPTR